MKKDLDRLRAFLDQLPPSPPAAFEFRHASWSDPDVVALLREKGAALCQADTDEEPVADIVSTAPWGYLRLRRTNYTDGDIAGWAEKVRAQPWTDAFVFLKHEDEARGPEFAQTLRAALQRAGAGLRPDARRAIALTMVSPWKRPFSMKMRLVWRPDTKAPATKSPGTFVSSVAGSWSGTSVSGSSRTPASARSRVSGW